ncbi:hypothetical protein GCM10010339_55970 [Streptomyces alanosinicus]|uniref:Uncharacterized protein n=1 Tax=Streptomyces alanosinicus TaxID=68171 RepID=A0A918YLX9_9ACTN|nr:hypothetical protein GCM10010339_55970 [Streptomyces alanosinicus]
MDAFDLLASDPGRGEDALPRNLPGMVGEIGEAGGVRADEGVVEHGAGPLVLGLQQQPVERLEQGEIAAGADLQEPVGYRRAPAEDSAGLLRMLEADESGLRQRVDRDDLSAVALGLLQRGQHPRMVGARVLPHGEDEVRGVDVVQGDTAFADAQCLLQRGAAGLVAHVGAVRQVVGAVGAGEELQQEGGFVVEPAGGVEEGLVRGVQPAQFPGEDVERLVPADRFVVGGARPLDHRLGQPALLIEPVIGSGAQFGDRIPAEELGRDPPRGGFVGDVLGAVLAVFVSGAVCPARARARRIPDSRTLWPD